MPAEANSNAPIPERDRVITNDSATRLGLANGTPALTPFFAIGGPAGPRDPSGLALGTDGKALYDYLDTSHTLVASLIADLKPLVTHRFKLDQIEAAYDLFSHQRDGVLKVAITP